MSCLPKPVLRGHIKRRDFKILIGALTFAVLNASLYYRLVKIPRKRAEEKFYESYDAEAHMRDLLKWGYIKTVKKEDI